MTARMWPTVAVVAGQLLIPAAAASQGLEVKYVRDSETYAVLTRQVYRSALVAVHDWVANAGQGGPWAVVLDVDETTLDNSTYQLELATYDTDYDDTSWNSWVARRQAGVVPGVIPFINEVRRMGGRVVWISNRFEVTREETRANLAQVGLWHEDDRLCLKVAANQEYTKAVRRQEIAQGQGACSWAGTPISVAAFLGDQTGDFPGVGEPFPGAGEDTTFGTRFFMIPNPMYGPWSRRVTRLR